MDDVDRASEASEMALAHAIFMARKSGPLVGTGTGFCLFCDEPVAEPGRRWCDAAHRDEWEKARRHA